MDTTRPTRLLVTAGPTHEPIDAVRYIGNRSSGRMGVELARAGADAGWQVTLLLGPCPTPPPPGVAVQGFVTAQDLQGLLDRLFLDTDVLIMAAAVADYRPAPEDTRPGGKHRRVDAGMRLELEATPDLLARCGSRRRADQLLVGFALEPEPTLHSSAQDKLARKQVDLIVANPLETMDAPDISARLVAAPELGLAPGIHPPAGLDKAAFADWLIAQLGPIARARRGGPQEPRP